MLASFADGKVLNVSAVKTNEMSPFDYLQRHPHSVPFSCIHLYIQTPRTCLPLWQTDINAYTDVITILNQYSVCKDNRHNPQKADVVTYNYVKLYKLYKKTATNSEHNSVFETTCSQTPTQDTQQEGWMHAAERQAGRQLHQHDSV